MESKQLSVKHRIGLHARPAAKFVKLAKGFESRISITNLTRKGTAVDAKSLVALVKIAVACGNEILLQVDGPDEKEAMEKLVYFLENCLEDTP